MKILINKENNYTIKSIVISHRFIGFPNTVCSGGKIYQLPRVIGNRSYSLKELDPKIHLGSIIYRIDSRRIFASKLKASAQRANECFVIEKIQDCPF